MPVGAAIGVGALTAGTSLVGAKVASNASKDAAKIQVDASNKALDLQKSIYDDQVKRSQPYVAAGNTALTNLMGTYATPFTDRVASYERAGRAAGTSGTTAPRGTLGAIAAPPQNQGPVQPNYGGQTPFTPNAGQPAPPRVGLIRVKAPTGEIADLPPDQAQRALSMPGVQRVA